MGTSIFKTKRSALSYVKSGKKYGFRKSDIKYRKRTKDYVIRW